MAKLKYDRIYRDLRQKIESGEYPVQEFLPSEFRLIEEYECSRNTVRRAIADLTAQGYVQPLHGKGVRVIYQPRPQSQYSLGKIESFKEASLRNHQEVRTRVVLFTELLVDGHIADRTPFEVGTEIYYIQRPVSGRHGADYRPQLFPERYRARSDAGNRRGFRL